MTKEVYLSPKGTAGFMAVDKANAYKDPKTGAVGKPTFTATVIVPEAAVADLLPKLQPVLDEYYADVSKKDKTIKKLPVFPAVLSKETGEATGDVRIKATSLYAVQVLDSKKNIMKGVPVRGGSTIQVAFTAKPVMIDKEVYLKFYLVAVKVSKLSEGADYSSHFEADADEDAYVYAGEGAAEGTAEADAVNI